MIRKVGVGCLKDRCGSVQLCMAGAHAEFAGYLLLKISTFNLKGKHRSI